MFFEIQEKPVQIEHTAINPDILTVGCVSCRELTDIGTSFGFDEDTIVACQNVNPLFQTGVNVHGKYSFAEIRIINKDGHEDSVAIYIKKNFILVVDIQDEDNSTINTFLHVIKKYPCSRMNEERLIACFIETLLSDGSSIFEEIHNQLTEMEESIVKEHSDPHFNVNLLNLKKKIRRYYNFYGQIIDIAETLSENENEILCEDNLMYISNLIGKVVRLREDMNSLVNIADHIQGAYATMLDQKMNSTMKILTILTTIFFPLTIIVGWYGMNFKYMPELTWKYGYLFVVLLSLAVIGLFIFIGKKKKWF